MDVVSDAIAAIRTGRPSAERTHRHAPWGLRFPPSSGPGFHVILQGGCWLLPCDESPPIALAAGDVVFVSHGRIVALADHPSSPLVEATREMDDAWSPLPGGPNGTAVTAMMCGSYQFDRIRPHPLLAELPDIIHLPKRVGQDNQLASIVELLGDELHERRPGTDAIITGLLDMMLLYILRIWYQEQAPATSTGWQAALNDPAVSTALHQMHLDPAHPWTVAELGHHAGLSRAAFARRFSAMVGRPPLDYLTWWRMTTAGTLLRLEDMPLHAIAHRAGYISESAFNRAFKREFGITPGNYRRKHLRDRNLISGRAGTTPHHAETAVGPQGSKQSHQVHIIENGRADAER
jgi:AraC-like DNA-binding protein